uniref:Peptidase A2 domain-containing protein n=1 Tax=Sinocyclocheilus grahami TaxID=75366 RepID=A0A672SDB6_SINGR
RQGVVGPGQGSPKLFYSIRFMCCCCCCAQPLVIIVLPNCMLIACAFSAQTARSMIATANSIVNRPVFMPETFTGGGRDWSEQFEMAAEVNNWNGDLKFKLMSLLLSGRARDVFCGLTIEDCSSYAKLKEVLSKRRLPGESGVGVFLSARVGGAVCDLLLDTDARVSVVSKEFWQKATNGGSELVPYLGKVSVADGGQMNIVGTWSTLCQIEALALATDFLVADIPLQEIILGTDFLRKFGAVIYLNALCCTLMGKSLPIQLGEAILHTDSSLAPTGGGSCYSLHCTQPEGFLHFQSLRRHEKQLIPQERYNGKY